MMPIYVNTVYTLNIKNAPYRLGASYQNYASALHTGGENIPRLA